MVKRCCISNCDSKLGSATIFGVPKADVGLFTAWSNVIALASKIVLRESHFVCEKHFAEEDIRAENIIKDQSGKIIFERKLQKKSLIKGAVPTIFNNYRVIQKPSHEEITNDIKPDINNIDHVMRLANYNETISEKNTSLDSTLDTCVDIAVLCSIKLEPESTDKESLFLDLLQGTVELQLQNSRWSCSRQISPNLILFQEAGKLLNSKDVPWYKKQITLNADLKMEIFILNKHFSTLDNLNNLQNLQNAINKVAEMSVCMGGPCSTLYSNVTPRCAYKDFTGHWRHNHCTLDSNLAKICKHCRKLDNTLRQQLRIRKGVSESYVPVRSSKIKRISIEKRRLYTQS